MARNRKSFGILFAATLVSLVAFTGSPALAQTREATVVTVQLGEFGGGFTLVRTDSGGWERDGRLITSGFIATGRNGLRYRLTLQDGEWSAAYIRPQPLRIPLGTSGTTILIQPEEGPGTFTLDGEPVQHGAVVESASGRIYMLRFLNGRWDAVLASPVVVSLGQFGGQISLVQDASGQWRNNNRIIRDGDIVRGRDGREYRLNLSGGVWIAAPLDNQIFVDLPGTFNNLLLTLGADGEYRWSGRVVRSGDIVQSGGQRYRLTLSGGRWFAQIVGVSGIRPGEDELRAYEGVRPTLTDSRGIGTREGNVLVINDNEYSLDTLFLTGIEESEATLVEVARDEIEQILATARRFEENRTLTDSLADSLRERVEDHLDTFLRSSSGIGRGSRALRNVPRDISSQFDRREFVDELEDIVRALGSRSRFEDLVDDAGLDPRDADEIYDAVRSFERLGFGATQNTRFGAYTKWERRRIDSNLFPASGTDGIGAFAYSPWGALRTRVLPSRGQATYVGETVATSRSFEQLIYRGAIQLQVDFSRLDVDGFVTGLRDNRGDPWLHSLGAVETIQLAGARLSSTSGGFGSTSSFSNSASIVYASGSTSRVRGNLEGQFVGPPAGTRHAIIGTWSISRSTSSRDLLLTGGFGAEAEGTPTVVINPPVVVVDPPVIVVDPPVIVIDPPIVVDPVVGGPASTARTFFVTRPDIGGDIGIAARDADGRRVELDAATLAAAGGTRLSGPRLFDQALDAIREAEDAIQNYREAFDSTTYLSRRRREWTAINNALEDFVFGRTSGDILEDPYSGSVRTRSALLRRDDDALDILRQAAEALVDRRSFEDAVRLQGVFEGAPRFARSYDFAEMSEAFGFDLRVEFGSTNFGHFGAWSKTTRPDAASPARTATGSERPDVFAYSPLEQTVYSSNFDHPADFRATYAGRTLAVDTSSDGGGEIFEGDIELRVDWGSRVTNSRVWATISNLIGLDTGRFEYLGTDVDRIVMGPVSVSRDAARRVEFDSTRPETRIEFLSSGRSDRRFGLQRGLEGQFVGDTAFDGPEGVIGIWRLGNLKGAYSADLAP